MPVNIKQIDQSAWVCYEFANKSYYFGQVGYLDQSGIVLPNTPESSANPKNTLVKHGFGVYIYQAKQNIPTSSYQGFWDRDQKNGQGKLKFQGCSYQGSFKEGFYHGQGKMIWKNGDSYQGGWKKSKLDGAGLFKHRDNFTLKGIFKNNYYIDGDILRNPQMSQKQYACFKKQRKQVLRQKQKQQKVKHGFIKIIGDNQVTEIRQNIKKSVMNNRVPLIFSSNKSKFNLAALQQIYASQNKPTNSLDLKKIYTLKGQQKFAYRSLVHENYRKSLVNGETFIINLDESQEIFHEMFYPDLRQYYQTNGFNKSCWSRKELELIKDKLIMNDKIHQQYELIVWTKYKLKDEASQDFVREKIQTRFQNIIPMVKIDCIFIQQQVKASE